MVPHTSESTEMVGPRHVGQWSTQGRDALPQIDGDERKAGNKNDENNTKLGALKDHESEQRKNRAR
jgi:hypothetical protein